MITINTTIGSSGVRLPAVDTENKNNNIIIILSICLRYFNSFSDVAGSSPRVYDTEWSAVSLSLG